MIPTLVYLWRGDGWRLVGTRRTYRGAKRLERQIKKVHPGAQTSIKEAWWPR